MWRRWFVPLVMGPLVLVTAQASGTPESDAGAARPSIPPDPPPLVERQQWVFDLRWADGNVFLVGVYPRDEGVARSTPRVMGRFALELYEGKTLIERVRFDFPMMGADERSDGGFWAPPRFQPKLRTRIGVLFPATRRGTRLELWDRAVDRRWPLPWPPRQVDGITTDGGAPQGEGGTPR